MIDFKAEIEKYRPALTTEEADKVVQPDEVSDVMDLLQYLNKKISGLSEGYR